MKVWNNLPVPIAHCHAVFYQWNYKTQCKYIISFYELDAMKSWNENNKRKRQQ